MTWTFECPNCGAPLAYPGPSEAVVRCSYCSSTVVLPASLQPIWLAGNLDLIDLSGTIRELDELVSSGEKIEAIRLYKDTFGSSLKDAKVAVERIERGEPVQLTQAALNSSGQLFTQQDADRVLAEVARLAQQGDQLAAVQLYRETFDSSLQEAEQVVSRLAQEASSEPGWVAAQVRASLKASQVSFPPAFEKKARTGSCLYAGIAIFMIAALLLPLLAGLARAGSPVQQTWRRLNPGSFARLVGSFGGQGTGAGQFSDPRVIAAGQDGSLYIGDYADGRIQRFDSRGQFLNQWFTKQDAYLSSLAVDRTGQVFAAYGGEIWRFDGLSGEALGSLPNPAGLNIDEAVLTPDGGLLAVASGEDLVRLDQNGQVQWIVEAAISRLSGEAELDTRLAVDGLGNTYALGTSNSGVFKFSPDGRFLNRWGSAGEQPGQFRAPNAIAVDRYGRVAVSDIRGVQVFAGQDGRYLDSFAVPGVVLGMAFSDLSELYAASNDHMVYRFRLKEPQPVVNRLIQPEQMVLGRENW